jgi:antitoxin component of MazEF toxin-antitoxin module
LQNDSAVEVSLASGKLVVAPLAKAKLTLKQLLAQVTKENVHHEVEAQAPVGKEAW